MNHTSIRANILKSFVALVLLISALLIGLQYYASKQLINSAVNKNFNQASGNIVNFIESAEQYTKNILNILSMNSNLNKKLKDETHTKLIEDFTHIMIASPKMKGIYIGYKNNDFFEVINLKNNPSFLDEYHVKQKTKWAVVTIVDNIKKIEFLDKELKILKRCTPNEVINVSSRLWYKRAIKSDDVIRTDVYKFKSTSSYGITFAKHIKGSDAVVALDYTLDNLDQFLQEQNFDENSYIILYKDNGEKIAASQDIGLEGLKYLTDFFSKQSKSSIKMLTYKNKRYFTYHTITYPKGDTNMHIGVLILEDSLLKPYMERIIDSLYASLIFIILTIPFVFYLTSKIVKPIQDLMEENQKVIQRKFSEVVPIKTDIKELYDFSLSFVSMSKSIQAYQKSQEELLDAVIKLIAQAIDAKSIYTGGHCRRVPEIAQTLADLASKSDDKPFKEFSFETKDEKREFHIAAWLHDCGKVTTPEYVVDKATKLETIYNRIHEIRTRFEVLFRDAQICYLQELLSGGDQQKADKKLKETQKELMEDFEFIASVNIGGEFMSQEMKDRVKKIAQKEWVRNFDDKLGLSTSEILRYHDKPLPTSEKLLDDKDSHMVRREGFDYEGYKRYGFKEEVPKYLYNYGEIYNLCIERGTLTKEERFKINEHVIMTIKMLEDIPFPENLSKIPEFAGTHHETMIGTGYPRKLTKKELSIPSRVMAIADIFEALTASDRPYKQVKSLSQALKIMAFMVKDEHIDKDLFILFLKSGVYMEYAKNHLKAEQIDEVDIDTIQKLC